MSGRGDNNKAGSSGRGASNQSNQGFDKASDQGKSYHDGQTGGKPSDAEGKKKDPSSNRNRSLGKKDQ